MTFRKPIYLQFHKVSGVYLMYLWRIFKIIISSLLVKPYDYTVIIRSFI